MRKLVKLPNSLLRQRSKEVKKVDSVKELAQEMVEFMQNRPADSLRPIGLSAVQLGELVSVDYVRWVNWTIAQDPSRAFLERLQVFEDWRIIVLGEILKEE